jgi:hypothetical protein
MGRLRMVSGPAASCAAGRAHNEGDLALAAEHITHLRRLVDKLVQTDGKKIDVHDLHDGPHPHNGRPDSRTDDRCLGDRTVHDPIFTVFLEKPLGGLKQPAVIADVLTQQEDPGISAHGNIQRFHNGFSKCQFPHFAALLLQANKSSKASSGLGKGDSMA